MDLASGAGSSGRGVAGRGGAGRGGAGRPAGRLGLIVASRGARKGNVWLLQCSALCLCTVQEQRQAESINETSDVVVGLGPVKRVQRVKKGHRYLRHLNRGPQYENGFWRKFFP